MNRPIRLIIRRGIQGTRIEYVNKHNRTITYFEDVEYESAEAAKILEFIELLKKDGVNLNIEIIETRK